MHGIETLPAALEQDADQIDHDIGVAGGGLDRARIAQIGRHRMDLADPSERLQVAGEIRPADRDPDPIAALAQGAHHMAAEEARAAEYGDQLVEVGLGDHAGSRGRHRHPVLPPLRRRPAAEYKIGSRLYRGSQTGLPRVASGGCGRRFDKPKAADIPSAHQAQVAELVDALVSGTSGESRGGSSSSPGHQTV